jgi:serine beta-lactamase-like protein LACTB, mitochondrial
MIRRIAFLALIVIAGATQVEAQSLTAKQVRAIRALVTRAMADHRAPGATFAIGRGGKIVWSEGFGLSDVENGVKAGPETQYRTASIGKSMTATAAMKLVEDGKLDLDAPIQKYCPRFPEKPWPITARDLISHTSGIRHYGGPNEQAELFNTKHYDHVSDAVDLFKDDPLKQQPGADMLYSTWGYVTLGCVLEGASGEEYRALMRHTIFDPAGMAHTRDDDPRAIVPHRARGYIFEDGTLKVSRWVDMSSKMAAGGWITTAPDLVRFLNAWMEGKLISRAGMKAMLTAYVLPRHGGTVDGFGMGWFLDDYHGMRAGLYGGGTPEVSGVVFFVPEKQLAVAGIFNLEEIPGAKRIALAEAIADVVLGEKTPNTIKYLQ